MYKMSKKGIIIIVSIALLFALFNVIRSGKTANGSVNIGDIGATSIDDPAGARLENVALVGHVSMMGLKEGDIVCKINGRTVKDADSFVKLFSNVIQESQVSIEVLRFGTKITIEPGAIESDNVSKTGRSGAFLRNS
jgi:S1-C subfamily serine protease